MTPQIKSEERVRVDSLEEVVIYYPLFKSIDHVCQTMPSKSDSTIIFCCSASFTGQLLKDFNHRNIAGNHVSSGVYYHGYSCRPNTGAFVYYDGKFKFLLHNYNEEMIKSSKCGGMGFGQNMIIFNHRTQPSFRNLSSKFVYRALCELNGEICVIESIHVVPYSSFISSLEKLSVKHALYLDMGSGWNYSWYRDNNGVVKEIHPYVHSYLTNWLVFRR